MDARVKPEHDVPNNLESSMPRPIIAVTDSVFPSLDPAKAALARVDPDIRMAKSAAADDILAVARDADAHRLFGPREPACDARSPLAMEQRAAG